MRSALEILRSCRELGTLPPDDLAYLADRATIVSVAEGEHLFEQGDVAQAAYVLSTGEVAMTFRGSKGEAGGPVETVLRRFDSPGTFLGWSALVDPHRYRATVTGVVPTTLLELSRGAIEERMDARPEFGVALMERVISVVGNRLRDTRIRAVARRYQAETYAIRALLDQSAEVLRVDSPLHKIPHYLESRLTLGDAFRTLELVQAHGDRTERDLAALALEILRNVRREVTLYRDLQRVYEAVANASPGTPPEVTRRRCCEEFSRLYSKLDYVIQGAENLPDSSGHIFIMNHLSNHPENTLPNRFQLTLDSHFVSAMLLLRKYGEAPIRVIRKSQSNEFGHQLYYDRLGYLYVAPAYVDASAAGAPIASAERRRLFLDAARDHLRAGRNLVICPEGTSGGTEASPLPFRAGAFRLALYVEPEPLIVPVAVANFDKAITRTRLAACVHQPFRLSSFVSRTDPDAVLFDFVRDYHQRFSRYVRAAEELARA